jgi:hypothetical protein
MLYFSILTKKVENYQFDNSTYQPPAFGTDGLNGHHSSQLSTQGGSLRLPAFLSSSPCPYTFMKIAPKMSANYSYVIAPLIRWLVVKNYL